MTSLTSNSLRMMEKSMDFLWTKQAAHLDNIANAETPGYKVKTVTFEERFNTLLKAMGRGVLKDRAHQKARIREAIEDSRWTVDDDGEITRMDENGVNVLEQSLESVRTAYQLQYVYQTIRNDLNALSRAING